MSVQAILLNAYFRRFVKMPSAWRSFTETVDIANRVADKPRQLPKGARLTSVAVNGVNAEWIGFADSDARKTILYFHGGGYCILSSAAFRHLTGRLAARAGAQVLAHDYRLAPAHPFPAAVNDSIAVYTWLLENGRRPDDVVFVGDSAGGGLAVATLVSMRDQKIPQPAGAALISPWADLTPCGPENRPNAEADPLIHWSVLNTMAPEYYGTASPEDPHVSPVFADMSGLPPLFIHVGSTEILRHDAELLARGVDKVGGDVTLSVWKNMPHVWHTLDILPEAKAGVQEVAEFCGRRLFPANA